MADRRVMILVISLAVLLSGAFLAFPTEADAPSGPDQVIDALSVSGHVRGDLNGDGEVSSKDPIYLICHVVSPSHYPLDQDADFDSDGDVTIRDAFYLALSILDPYSYPLTEEDSPYPEGIWFDPGACELRSPVPTVWTVTDELEKYVDKEVRTYKGKSLELEPGWYTVSVNGDTFQIMVDGVEQRTVQWEYWSEGMVHSIQITYDIRISDLVEASKGNREWNDGSDHLFKDLPRIVVTDPTTESIVSQLGERFAEIGGDADDRQSFADFVSSFVQNGIRYPSRIGSNGSTDYEVWGSNEYWSLPLETLYYCIGDCEDSSALACALLKSAGYQVAMVGVSGHVVAGVSLDSFVPVDEDGFTSYNPVFGSFVEASGSSIVEGDDTGIIYYGLETTKGQTPVGYLLRGTANNLGKPTLYWGTAGFYPA
jgi:transglutaminase-like putative cysteine protease